VFVFSKIKAYVSRYWLIENWYWYFGYFKNIVLVLDELCCLLSYSQWKVILVGGRFNHPAESRMFHQFDILIILFNSFAVTSFTKSHYYLACVDRRVSSTIEEKLHFDAVILCPRRWDRTESVVEIRPVRSVCCSRRWLCENNIEEP